ncbi:MAG: PmoA family protein [Planctomycetaceae bacterium]
MKCRTNLLLAAFLGLFASVAPTQFAVAADNVTLTKGKETVKIAVGDDVFGVYQFSGRHKKPYLIAVSAPDGKEILNSYVHGPRDESFPEAGRVFVVAEAATLTGSGEKVQFGDILDVDKIGDEGLYIASKKGWLKRSDAVPLGVMVTRVIEDPPSSKSYDHVHHKGVWNTVDEVNGVKFWKEDGRIENQSVELVTPSGNPAVMKVVNQWLGPDGNAILNEQTTISIYANRLYVYDITFSPAGDEAVFEDTKEGMFAIRMPESMTEKKGMGPVVNAEGMQGTKSCWGRTSPWVDYIGPIGANKFGLTIMDHPENPRKSRYHVRDYGLFSINPFGTKSYTAGTDAPQPADVLTLKKGETFRARYALYVRHVDSKNVDINTVYEDFVKAD